MELAGINLMRQALTKLIGCMERTTAARKKARAIFRNYYYSLGVFMAEPPSLKDSWKAH
jgi:hypothetical protein